MQESGASESLGPSDQSSNSLTGFFVIVFFVVVVGAAIYFGTRSAASPLTTPNPQGTLGNGFESAGVATPMGEEVTELMIEDIKVGTGDEALAGKAVDVHYEGYLIDGRKFDSSRERGAPFTFTLGAGEVIRGWDEGLVGMKVGGVRKLTIPPDKGYGAAGAGGVIPPNATLIFEVELLGVK